MMYYIIVDGVKHGPVGREELLLLGMTADSYVWREGLSEWVRASELEELRTLFPVAGPPVPPPVQPLHQPYNPVPPTQPAAPYPPQYPFQREPQFPANYVNWKPWAIISLVCGVLFCCLAIIFAVIGLVNANKANMYYSQGWAERGNASNSSARLMVIIAFVLEASALGYMIFNWNEIMSNYLFLFNGLGNI